MHVLITDADIVENKGKFDIFYKGVKVGSKDKHGCALIIALDHDELETRYENVLVNPLDRIK